MAQRRGGEARSVPDPAGDLYDEMLKAKREGRLGADDTVYRRVAQDYFSPAKDPLAFARQPQARKPGLQVDGRSVDAPSVVVDPNATRFTPAELGRQREAISRAFFMADNPMAGAAYGISSALGASPRDREIALGVGGTLDAVMQSAAPLGSPPSRRPPAPPLAEAKAPPLALPPITYRAANADGLPAGTSSFVTAGMVGPGTRADRRIRPPGFLGDDHDHARGHLHAAQLGGSPTNPLNFVTLTQTPTNSPRMRDFENAVAARARAGEAVEYRVTPLYSRGIQPPGAILLTANGSRGPVARVVPNPAGGRR